MALADVLEQVRNDSEAGVPMPESKIIHMLMQRFPSTQVHSLVDNMIKTGMLKQVGGLAGEGARGFRTFVAGDKAGVL